MNQIMLIVYIRHCCYFSSYYQNKEIISEKLEKSGYIVFTKKLCYMGCNKTAAELFPELEKWELEKKVPGNGGRFNTFFRQPLMQYILKPHRTIKR